MSKIISFRSGGEVTRRNKINSFGSSRGVTVRTIDKIGTNTCIKGVVRRVVFARRINSRLL